MAEPPVPVPAAPAPITDASGLVHMQDASGNVVRVAPGDVGQAQGQGFTYAGQEAVGQQLETQEWGGIGGQVLSGLAGAARGLTFGLSDAAIAELGGREELAAMQRVNPGVSTLGEIGGGIAGALLSGGTSAASRVLSAPTRFVSGIGGLVERGVAGVAGRGLASATGGAIAEGILGGVGSAISEAAISGKPEEFGEYLASNVGLGAAMSGGLSLGLGLLGRGARGLVGAIAKPEANAVATVAANHFGTEPSRTLGKRVAEGIGTLSSVAGAGDKAVVAGLLDPSAAGAAKRYRVLHKPELMAQHLDDFTRELSGVHGTVEQMGSRFKGALKREQIARVVADVEQTAAIASARDVVRDALDTVDAMLDPTSGISPKGGKNLRRELKAVRGSLDDAIERGDVAGAFVAADSAKRELGRVRQKLSNAEPTPTVMKAQRVLEDSYERMRVSLEDSKTWGKAADIQKSLNEPWSELIQGSEREAFSQRFLEMRKGKWGKKEYSVDRKKIDSFLATSTNPAESDAWKALDGYLDRSQRFVDAADANLVLTDAERAEASAMRDRLKTLRKRVDEVKQITTEEAQYQALKGKAGGSLAAGVIGGSIAGGGPVLGALGAAASVVLDPARAMRGLAALEQIVGRTKGVVTGGINGVASRAAAPAGRQLPSRIKIPRAGATSWSAPLLASRAGLAAQRYSSARSDRDEVDRRSRVVSQLASSKSAIPDAVRATLGPLQQQAPTVVAQAQMALERARDYLAKHSPPTEAAALHRPPPEWSDTERQRYLDSARALDAPEELLRTALLGSGAGASPAALEAVREVSPAIWSSVRDQVADRLTELAGDDQELPYEDRQRLGLAFDLPLDEMIRPDVLSALQAAYNPAQQPPPPAPTGRPSGPHEQKTVAGYASPRARFGV